MTVPYWLPQAEVGRQEQWILKRLTRTKKLFAFLRLHRHELFDRAFQDELAEMYRESGEGKEPVAPALLAMVVLLQAYTKASDADAVELSAMDGRWQLVLDHLGKQEPAFSQGALQSFRQRLIAHDMDRRLLERTVELARQTKIFDWKKLPKELRLAVDSRPIEGAGKVEDTINLLAHAARKLLICMARILEREPDDVARDAGAPLLTESSIKKGLDIEWSDAEQKNEAIVTLIEQLDRLEARMQRNLRQEATEPPLSEHIATLHQLREQDLEPDPTHSARRRPGPPSFGRRRTDASRSQKQIQALQRLQGPHRHRGLDAAARTQVRRERSLPIFDALYAWISELDPKLLPKSPLREATNYALGQQSFLCRCFEDGRFEIDNGRVERRIRPFAVSRRNFLFTGSVRGGERLAVVYTLVDNCLLLGLEPQHYLEDVMVKIQSGWPLARLSELTPARWALEHARQHAQ